VVLDESGTADASGDDALTAGPSVVRLNADHGLATPVEGRAMITTRRGSALR
jgi:hypothetical protein